MTAIKSLTVVMPAYNEEVSIEKVIRDLVRVLRPLEDKIGKWDIICVDDCSVDSTLSILNKIVKDIPELRIIKNAHNMGILKTLERALAEARGEYVYITASDGQWPANNLLSMIQIVFEHSAEMVIGVRRNKAMIYGWWRRFISWSYNFLPELLFNVKTADAGSHMLCKSEVFKLPLISSSVFAQAERIIAAKYNGISVMYTNIDFHKRTSGKATGAKLTNITGSIRDCIKCF